jgi:hypothetical protein
MGTLLTSISSPPWLGADFSLRHEMNENIAEMIISGRATAEVKLELFAALKKHGIRSDDIPEGFQSELYFQSKYYQANVREQRWIERRVFMMCLDRVFKWSLANQIESERLMTLPAGLSSIGLLVAKCCVHVDASSVSNGIARLIMHFAFGFKWSKQGERLIGMPREGAWPGAYSEMLTMSFYEKIKGRSASELEEILKKITK